MAMVENRCSLLSLLPTALLFITASVSIVNGQSGVYLSLNGVNVPNDSYVLFSDIGAYDTGLHCNTDRSDCCRGADHPSGVAQGHWYRPNGREVMSYSLEDTGFPRNFFSRNRAPRIVRLNRIGDPPETDGGLFRCEIPNDAGSMVTMYVNIVDMLPPPLTEPPITTTNETPPTTTAAPTTVTITDISITSSGTNIAGESYSLVCTVTVTGSTDQPTITWLDPMDNIITSGVVMTGSMSTLTFNPLAASHAGTYTCRATLDSAMDSESRTITVRNPAITVSIAPSVATPMVGSMYSLTCTVTGAESLTDAMMTHQWFKNGVVVSGQTMATLSFSPLTFSDAGSYICKATVTSSLLSAPITTTSSNSLGVRLTLPRPTAVKVSTNQVNPLMVRPVGSTVTLTCMADWDPVIDVPVIVNIQLSDPAGRILTTTTPSVSGSTYTTTSMISSFGRSESGPYTCSATISPSPSNSFLSRSSSRSETLRVTTGIYLSLKGIVYANNSFISITEIGETNSISNTGLQCVTDNRPCCSTRPNRHGEWLFPDGNTVPGTPNNPITFYQNRGDDGTVNLNRLSTNNNIMMPTGLFCCEVPDAIGVIYRICANIIHIAITPSSVGIPTAGQTYSLNCSLTGTTDTVTYQWFKGLPSNGTQLTNTSQLQFSSLRASDAGFYTCRTTVGSMAIEETNTVTISLPVPTTVTVTPSVVPIIVGSSTNLTCTVELSPLVDVPVTVNTEWTGSGPDGFMTTKIAQPVMGSNINYTSTTMVSSSGREQSGDYTCGATVRAMSSSLIDSVGYSSSRVIVVPEPIVSVHSDSPNNVLYGHPPTLICTVEMSSVVNVPLSMMTVWKGPDGAVVASPTRPEMKSFTLYTSSNSLSSVDSADSGEYTCTVRFKNGVEISATTNITIVDGVFQLRLKSVGICQQYSESSDKPKQYGNFIKGALVTAIKHHCKCHFPVTNLNKDSFICEDSPNIMIYRNTLIGTLNFNGTQIVDFIQDWVSTGPLIEIDGNSVRVDSSCPTAISSLNEPVCGEKKEECLYDNDPNYVKCAQHLDDDNVASCFEGCIVRNR